MADEPAVHAMDPRAGGPPRMVEELIPPGGVATVALLGGDELAVINVHGHQVVDCWAYTPDWRERSSMEHTRVHSQSIRPTSGHTFYSNARRPMFTMTEDTSGGNHDTLLAACDPQRYHLLGHQGHHANCSDNHRVALRSLDREAPDLPSPLNLFENVEVGLADGHLDIVPPSATALSHCTLRADLALVFILSVCPQDLAPTNGAAMRPAPVLLRASAMSEESHARTGTAGWRVDP